MAGVFGDTLAMALVAIGSVLIALLIWLLMRKYNREYPRNVEPSKMATPATISRETTAASIWGPCKKPNENPSVTGLAITQQISKELGQKPKETPAVFPCKKPASAEKPTDKPTDKTTDNKKDKPADKREDAPAADKKGVDAKAQGHGSKKREGSTGSAGSLEQNKEQLTKDEKSKKSDQLSAMIVDSGSSKHKSKQPKRSKAAEAQPDSAIATTDAGAVSPKAPPGVVAQEPAIDTTAPALPQKPSQVEAPAPQASQLGAKSPTVAIVDQGPASDTHDLDDSTLRKLRKEVLMRRASHASTHSTRLRPAVESPKVPTELDIFSEEHSAASIARATMVREKQSHLGHKQKHKHKSSSSRKASSIPIDEAFATSKSECASPPPGLASPLGISASAVPAPEARDVEESTLKQLRRDISMRRASHVSQHSLRPAPRVAKVPTELDIFSEEHSAASIARATTVREKQSQSGHKQKHKPKSPSSRPASTVPVDVAFASSKSECTSPPPGLVSPPGASAVAVSASDARDGNVSALEEPGRACYVPQPAVLPAPRVAKAPSDLEICSEEHASASAVETTSQLHKSKEGGKHKHKRKHKQAASTSRPQETSSPPVAATGTTAKSPALPIGNLDESTVEELRRDISKRRASHVSVRSLRQMADAATVPAELDIFSEQHSAKSNVPAGCVRVELMRISTIPDTADAGPPPETGDLDEHTIQQLRQDLMKRRASHASMHSVRSVRAPPKESASPKVPAELDIFSEQHSSESNVLAGGVRVKLMPTSTIADTPDAGPAPETGDLDEHTVQQLRQDLMKRRASHASMHSVRSIRAPPKESSSTKVPTELDIFSEQHSSIGPNEDPQLKKKKATKIFSQQPSPE